jgi:hypothetical protein
MYGKASARSLSTQRYKQTTKILFTMRTQSSSYKELIGIKRGNDPNELFIPGK